jgi:hypothetical protein
MHFKAGVRRVKGKSLKMLKSKGDQTFTPGGGGTALQIDFS